MNTAPEVSVTAVLPMKPCSVPEHLHNIVVTDVTPMDYRYGLAASFLCRHGFAFVAGGTLRSVMCIDGYWLEEIQDCQGSQLHTYM